jgi:pimeloyl-ACP methyl ester carboxylesterase
MGGNAKDPWPLLPEIKCPVLLVEGGESENRTYIDLKYAASLFPQGSYTEVPGAGHLVPMEQPDAVYRIISEFFSK